jgi:hypothetical protein
MMIDEMGAKGRAALTVGLFLNGVLKTGAVREILRKEYSPAEADMIEHEIKEIADNHTWIGKSYKRIEDLKAKLKDQ